MRANTSPFRKDVWYKSRRGAAAMAAGDRPARSHLVAHADGDMCPPRSCPSTADVSRLLVGGMGLFFGALLQDLEQRRGLIGHVDQKLPPLDEREQQCRHEREDSVAQPHCRNGPPDEVCAGVSGRECLDKVQVNIEQMVEGSIVLQGS
jgi:hypothetical protein